MAFLGPLLVVVLINTLVVVLVTVILVRHTRKNISRKKESIGIKTVFRLILSVAGIMFLFGCSWLFAALTITVEEIQKPAQVLFTVFSSLQGFFIFVFFCIVSKEARELWKEVLSCGKYQSVYLNPSIKVTKKNAGLYSNISTIESTPRTSVSTDVFVSKKQCSSGTYLELANTSHGKKRSSSTHSEPLHPRRREKNINLSGTNVVMKDANDNSDIYSETELRGMDYFSSNKRDENESTKVAEGTMGINTIEIYENKAGVVEDGEDDRVIRREVNKMFIGKDQDVEEVYIVLGDEFDIN